MYQGVVGVVMKSSTLSDQAIAVTNPGTAGQYFDQHNVATLPSPWAMVFLPDGRMLVSERPAPGSQLNPTAPGNLRVVTQAGQVSSPILGLPGNVGVLDVILDPNFAQNHTIYFSYIDRDPSAPRIGRNAADTRVDPAGIAVVRAVIDVDAAGGPALTSSTVIWHQFPDIVSFPGSGEPGGRLTFSPDGNYLFIAAGDRQEFSPVQALDNTLGKIVRIFPDGSIPPDNPYVGIAGALPEIWSLGHRNQYGLTFTRDGTLWEHEMGPAGGDELNIITPHLNYGWPNVSYGNGYDGTLFPKPAPGDGFAPSVLWWTPVIAPSSMIAYSGSAFPQWQDDFIISGLQSKGLVIVHPSGTTATEIDRVDLGGRVRDVVQGPDGTLWVLYDQPDGRLVQLFPHSQVGHDGDFNGDGRSDVLWRNDAGQVGDWSGTATGGFIVNDGSALRSVSPAWNIVGRGDFNGDGRDDILWRDDSGSVKTWSSTASGSFTANDALASYPVPKDWMIVGTGDFNGDGRDDILWRSSDGAVGIWTGNPVGDFTPRTGSVRGAPRDWHIVTTGDFDKDGFADIVWRNNDGTVGTWSGSASGDFVVRPGTWSITRDWLVVGAGDFNGDGIDDLLWRNADGSVGDWLGQVGGGFTINRANIQPAPNAWHIESIGDYNGDHRDDILWRNDAGQVSDWLGLAAGSFISNGPNVVLPIPQLWHVQSDLLFV